MVAHLLAFGLPIAVCIFAVTNFSFFALHPMFMIIAFGLLMTEAMLLFSPESSLEQSGNRMTRADKHGKLLILTLFIILAGFGVIFYNKQRFGKSHFTTWHGTMGLTAVGYVCFQVLAGIMLKNNKIFKPYLPAQLTLARWKLIHAFSGCIAYLLGQAAVMLGLQSSWFVDNAHEYLWCGCCIAVVFLIGICVNHLKELLVQTQKRIQQQVEAAKTRQKAADKAASKGTSVKKS